MRLAAPKDPELSLQPIWDCRTPRERYVAEVAMRVWSGAYQVDDAALVGSLLAQLGAEPGLGQAASKSR